MSDNLFEEFEHLEDLEALRKTLWKTQQALRTAKAKTEDLVKATVEAATEATLAIGAVKAVAPPKVDTRKGKPEVALWHLTDWQGSKVTATYNSEVMRERILRFCDRAKKVTDIQRAHHPVRECVILFGGDHIEGLFNFPQQPFEIDAGLHDQWLRVGRLQIDVVRLALADHDKVTVVGEWGNHGRIGGQRAAIPRSDNLDRITQTFARQVLEASGENRLTWNDSIEDIQHVEIGNYRALLIHGDEIGRNGFASKNTIINHINRWRGGGHSWEFQDVYMGHYHTPGEEALADGVGSAYWTGAPESDNRYAGVRHASSARPSQRLHFIEPERGEVTAQYAKVWLD